MATVTFAAGLAVLGGYNGSGTGQGHGFATAMKKTMFHVFSECNMLTVFNSMVVVLMLLYAQINDPQAALFAYGTAVLPLLVAPKCPRIHGRLEVSMGNVPTLTMNRGGDLNVKTRGDREYILVGLSGQGHKIS
ncbi:hypothetical protein NL676_000859 [Syzygium grande]|nr:hypothetical protein NL676_000859 [Syzygium grande]